MNSQTIPKPPIVGLFASVLLLCSCATGPHPSGMAPRPKLPGDVTMNKDAGRGGHLYVTLRLDSGEELPFLVDTGAPTIVLAKSLEPRLGKCLGATTLWNFGTRYDGSIYQAPKLYLGDTPLVTDSNTLTSDIIEKTSSRFGRPVMGILGMDCLQHYCIQLDFRAGKMRFLDPNDLKTSKLGEAFPITSFHVGQNGAEPSRLFIRHSSLVGGEDTDLLIDTGSNADGFLTPELFQQEQQKQRLREPPDAAAAQDSNNVELRRCIWSGTTYTDLWIENGKDAAEGKSGENALGLRFLARHLVTFDFPHRIMYLKQARRGPLVDPELVAAGRAAGNAVFRLARKLRSSGQLPGWSKKDRGTGTFVYYFHRDPDTVVLDIPKKGDPFTYHCEFTRTSQDSPWHLRRAWRTDQDDHMVEQYPVP